MAHNSYILSNPYSSHFLEYHRHILLERIYSLDSIYFPYFILVSNVFKLNLEGLFVKAYIAGPLFVEDSRIILEKIDNLCKELKIDTFLPHRDAGLYDNGDSKIFFDKNKEALDECDIVIAYLDWKGISSGTAWEIGYAYAKNVPIIALAEDPETLKESYRICVMNFNSVKVVGSLEELRRELEFK